MKPRIKMGLAIGALGLALNVCVSALVGFCGPVVSLVAGAAAGFFAVQQEKPSAKAEGGRVGAIAGAIAGALVIIGQVIGGLGALAFLQVSGIQLGFGNIPSPSADASTQLIYYLSGMGTSFCFGIVGALLAAGAGAGAGYLATTEQPVSPPASPVE
ncbi:MAG: hypothetical protein Kow0070_06170 [Anaerolineales bacterium]